MARFFINRPIVAMVISIIMVIIGVVAMVQLPIAQYPELAPPEILVQATYVGADSQTIEQSVATPIEQQMQGVDKMLYMNSVNDSTGVMRLRVTFDVGTNPNDDQILSQMRYSLAESQLPGDVRNYGVSVRKSPSAPFAVFSLYSPNGTYDGTFLSNYAYININDPMSRVPGVGQVTIFGAGQYAMRFWVRPDTLAELGRHHQRYHRRAHETEHREPRRSDRRRAGPTRPGVHLHSSSAGTSAEPGGVWQHRRPRQPGRLDRADEGCRSCRAGRAELQSDWPVERKTGRDHRHLPAPGLQRDRYHEPRQAADGGVEEKISARPRLYDLARHHPGR